MAESEGSDPESDIKCEQDSELGIQKSFLGQRHKIQICRNGKVQTSGNREQGFLDEGTVNCMDIEQQKGEAQDDKVEGELNGEARRRLGLDGVRGLNAEVFALREIRKPLKAFEEVSDSTRTLFKKKKITFCRIG